MLIRAPAQSRRSAATGELLATLTGSGEPIWSVAFSPNGRTLVSASDAGVDQIRGVVPSAVFSSEGASLPDLIGLLSDASRTTRQSIPRSLQENEALTAIELQELTGEDRYNLYPHLAKLQDSGRVDYELENSRAKRYF